MAKNYVPGSTFYHRGVVPDLTSIFVYNSGRFCRKPCQMEENILNISLSIKFISCWINCLKHLTAAIKGVCHATFSLSCY